jgi:P27 family predicted phage terminase small subunit
MRGRKPKLQVVGLEPVSDLPARPPSWLNAGAQREWARCSAELNRRGLLFDGALANLATYCALIDQIEQLARTVAKEGLAGPAQKAMLATAAQARMYAAELGLSVVSRTRSFQGQSSDERAWADLEVG